MNQQQFKESWGQLSGHLKKHWDKLTNEDYALINGDLARFKGVIEHRYGPIHGDVGKGVDRWYAKWTGWYEGYEEAKS